MSDGINPARDVQTGVDRLRRCPAVLVQLQPAGPGDEPLFHLA